MERAEMERTGQRLRRKSRKAFAGKAGRADAIRTRIDPQLSALFEGFADQSSQFSRDLVERYGGTGDANNGDNALLNL